MKIVKVVTTTTTTVFRKQLQEEEQVFLFYIWHISLLRIFNLYIILSLIELFSLMFIAANRAQRKCSLSPQLRSALHGKSSQITSLNGSLIFFWERDWDHQWQSFPPIEWTSKEIYSIKFVFIERKKTGTSWSWLNFQIWISYKERRGSV